MNQPPRFTPATGLAAAVLSTTLALACTSKGASSDAGPSNDARATGGTTTTTGASGGSTMGANGGSTTGVGGGSTAGASGGSTTGASGGSTTGASGGSTISGSGGMAGQAGEGAGAGSGGNAFVTGGSSGTGGRAGTGGGSAGGGGHAGAAGASWSSAFPTFIKHTIASFSGGYAHVVVDIDHDGKLDVVALSSGSAGLVWFKNPSWTKYTITTKAKQLIFMAPHDVDGDGDVDLAIVSDFSMSDTNGGGTISWAEAPADPTMNQDWALHTIDAVPTSHRLRWGDIDGDGKKELIDLPIFGIGSMAPAYAGFVQLKAYFIPADPKGGKWMSKVLDDKHLEVAHGIEIVDWDGDKAEDILTAANDGVDLFRPSLNNGAEHLGAGKDGQAPNKGSSEVVLGSLGGARFIATIEFWHGTDAVIYTPGASAAALWARQVIGSADFEHGHGMAVADLNGDGFDEVIGGGGQGAMTQLIYRYVPSSRTWDKIQLDLGGVAVSGIEVGDMNGDGAVDIVSIGTSPTNNVVWYENTRAP